MKRASQINTQPNYAFLARSCFFNFGWQPFKLHIVFFATIVFSMTSAFQCYTLFIIKAKLEKQEEKNWPYHDLIFIFELKCPLVNTWREKASRKD